MLLDPGMLPPDWGWRACFLIGAALGLTILFMRMWVPESPRWLITHNQVDEARQIVEDIEAISASMASKFRIRRSSRCV